LWQELKKMPNVSKELDEVAVNKPLIQSDSLPEYWCKVADDGTAYLFLAQWPSKKLLYPVYSGQSLATETITSDFTINFNGHENQVAVNFKPYQSVVLKISPDGKVNELDVTFEPKRPIVKLREKQRMNF
jgi:hypothetical protein